jgi:hypothetical protein
MKRLTTFVVVGVIVTANVILPIGVTLSGLNSTSKTLQDKH